MPFVFDPNVTQALPPHKRCIEDRTNNPVRGRSTKFRLAQRNMLAYTFPNFIPGFHAGGMNRHPFDQVVDQPVANAMQEGQLLYPGVFTVNGQAVSKVAGDIFQELESAILWNAAAHWNRFMAGQPWKLNTRRPTAEPRLARQVAVLQLPRNYDWVKLLTPKATAGIGTLRDGLQESHNLLLPTSTPDMVVVVLPKSLREEARFQTDLPGLDLPSQDVLDLAYSDFAGLVEPGEIILAIASKKSLRSDRLYQPLYEANIMQLLLEGELGAPKVEFEVHTLDFQGTGAVDTYRAASLYGVATRNPDVHRAVRDLYKPKHSEDLVRRLLDFLDQRTQLIPGP